MRFFWSSSGSLDTRRLLTGVVMMVVVAPQADELTADDLAVGGDLLTVGSGGRRTCFRLVRSLLTKVLLLTSDKVVD